jgi:hypothetical protein
MRVKRLALIVSLDSYASELALGSSSLRLPTLTPIRLCVKGIRAASSSKDSMGPPERESPDGR